MRYYPKTVIPPVKIHGLKVKGKDVELSTMFEEGNKRLEKPVREEAQFDEDDDFLEHATFEVSNRSDKPVEFIEFAVKLYTEEGVKKRSFDYAFFIYYGMLRPDGTRDILNPGDTVTVSISDAMAAQNYQPLFDELRKIAPQTVRVGIHINRLIFKDYSSWDFDGTFTPSKKSKESPYEKRQSRFKKAGKQPKQVATTKPAKTSPYSFLFSASPTAC